MRVVMSGVLLVCCFSVSLNAGGTTGKTPEEAFAAMQEAYRKSGPKGLLPHVTRESQKTLTGGMMATFFGFRKYVLSLKDRNPEAVEAIEHVMKRHGLEEEKLKAFIEKDGAPRGAEEAIANLRALADLVKDGPAFVEDVVATINRIKSPFPPIRLLPAGAAVKDVKVDGETARGTLHYRQGGKERSDDIFFQREAGAWKVDYLPGIRMAFMKK